MKKYTGFWRKPVEQFGTFLADVAYETDGAGYRIRNASIKYVSMDNYEYSIEIDRVTKDMDDAFNRALKQYS